jgi:hypothetical protein
MALPSVSEMTNCAPLRAIRASLRVRYPFVSKRAVRAAEGLPCIIASPALIAIFSSAPDAVESWSARPLQTAFETEPTL